MQKTSENGEEESALFNPKPGIESINFTIE